MRDFLTEYKSTQNNGVRNSNGIGYVIIKAKDNASRKKYIQNCILKGSVTIALENGGFIENVPVLKHVWNDIEFPQLGNKMGSLVLWNNIDKANVIVITGVIPKNNEIINRNENEFFIGRAFTQEVDGKQVTNYIEISGNADSGKINISIDGGQDDGELSINLFNQNKSTKLNVIVKGDINFDGSNDTNFTTKNNFNASAQNILNLLAKKSINLGTGKEPLVLGNTLKTEIEKTNNLLQVIVKVLTGAPITEAGNGAPSSLQQSLASAIRTQNLGDFSKILSKLSNTD